jgi:hypothetical protein
MHHILLNFNFLNFFLFKHECLIVLLFTYLLNILCITLVYDWFYIRQAYLVALIGSMDFYNKMIMMMMMNEFYDEDEVMLRLTVSQAKSKLRLLYD